VAQDRLAAGLDALTAGTGSAGAQGRRNLIFQHHALLAHLTHVQVIRRLDVCFGPVNGLIDGVIFIIKPGEMSVTSLERAQCINLIGEFFDKLMGGVRPRDAPLSVSCAKHSAIAHI
jgi:hypothetical protein